MTTDHFYSKINMRAKFIDGLVLRLKKNSLVCRYVVDPLSS